MTPVTALELEFADGQYLFDLKLPQLAELQEKRRAGVFAIYGRVMKGRYVLDGQPFALTHEGESFVEDIFETIRLGLIGGGRGIVDSTEIQVSPLTASRLVQNYCHPAPLRESWAVAAAILGARIEGYSPGPKAVPAKEPATAKRRRPRKSTSRGSSPTAASSGATGET